MPAVYGVNGMIRVFASNDIPGEICCEPNQTRPREGATARRAFYFTPQQARELIIELTRAITMSEEKITFPNPTKISKIEVHRKWPMNTEQ